MPVLVVLVGLRLRCPPQKQAISFNERCMADLHKEGHYRKTGCPYVFLCANVYDVGVSTDSVFQENRPGAGFDSDDFVVNRWGGTVERLVGVLCGLSHWLKLPPIVTFLAVSSATLLYAYGGKTGST